MKDTPNCKICELKCYGCSFYYGCGMRQGLNKYKVEDCTYMASEYYLFDKYVNKFNMELCKYQKYCQTAAKAWLDNKEGD